MKFLLSFLALAYVNAADWAVIVAGSMGYGNYRHQADVCHSYHVVNKFGIPDERVIVMMYDDIANNAENPYKGKMFNKPTAAGTPGVDVYEGCKKDYTGRDVTPENFIAVLTGDSATTGGKPVLKSTSSDRVFVNFVDHGGTGLIAFPSSTLSSTKLNAALKQMHTNNMYSKLVFYLEACESGSMFENLLPADLNIYATTASNAQESSWGTYCPPDDKVDGKDLNSCLGDLYSVNWMENADSVGKSETLADQFTEVKKTTDKSHVMQYGDMSFTSDPIGDYMGDSNTIADTSANPTRPSSTVSSRDIPLHLAYYKYLRAEKSDFEGRQELAVKLQKELSRRMEVDNLFYTLSKKVALDTNGDAKSLLNDAPQTPIICDECCDTIHGAFTKYCGGYDDYSLQFVRVVVNMCNHVNHDAPMAEKIAQSMETMCSGSTQQL